MSNDRDMHMGLLPAGQARCCAQYSRLAVRRGH